MTDTAYDMIIIGAGPAGLTAAIYAGRAAIKPLVLAGAMPGGQIASTDLVENFPGFPGGVNGFELAMNFQQQAEHFGAELVLEAATEVDLGANSLLEAMELTCGVIASYTKDSIRAILANAQECALLEIPAGSPVLAVDGLAFDEHGEPIRLSKAVYRGDKFRLAAKSTADQASVLVIEDAEV